MVYSYKGIIFINKNEQRTNTFNNIDESQKRYVEWKKPRHKRLHVVWFHLCELLIQAKLSYGNRDQTSGCLGAWARVEGDPLLFLSFFFFFLSSWRSITDTQHITVYGTTAEYSRVTHGDLELECPAQILVHDIPEVWPWAHNLTSLNFHFFTCTFFMNVQNLNNV